MKDALDVVMTWQLLNPDITDPEAAISAVKVVSNSSSAERKDSELSSALAQHFLTLTIRPLFSQTPQSQSQTKSSHPSHDDTPLWKDAKNATALDLLRWTLLTLSQKAVEQHWSLIVPPILKMIDDIDVQWKCRGVSLLTLFLQAVPASLLSRTGLSKVFEEELWPLCTYLPTLTPEQDSAKLLGETIRALSALVEVIHPEKHTNTAASKSKSKSPQPTTEPTLSSAREKLLDRLLRDAILAPLMHAPPPTYPLLATSLLAHLAPLLRSMGIDSVKHLQPLTSLLADILAEPLIMAHVELVCAACSALASLIENAWPRVPVYRGVIVRGLSVAWVRYLEHDGGDEKVLGEVVRGLRDVAGMLDMVCRNDGEVGGVWAEEKARLEEVDGRVGGLFGEG